MPRAFPEEFRRDAGHEAFDVFIASVIEQAERSDDASAEQLEILERAREEGDLSQALAREGLQLYIECLSQYGIRYEDLGSSGQGDYARFDGTTWAGDDVAHMDSCYNSQFHYIDTAYQTQPAAVAERKALTELALPSVRECLREEGYDAPESLTYDETLELAFFGLTGATLRDDASEPPEGWHPVNCFEGTGLVLEDIEWSESAEARERS